MSRLDLVIFGATGFTGKNAVEEMVRVSRKQPGLTWGVAGRSEKKLASLMQEVSKKTAEDLSAVKIIIADVSNESSLEEMCAQAKVIVNCCGPYRLYGEPVVKAAIMNKTHCVDVCGEPQFIETMQLKYDAAAREAGALVVSACGYDSVPNDMGTVFLQQHFDGTLNSVESFMSSDVASEYRMEAWRRGSIHYGTWESLVYGLEHYSELGPLRKKLYPERLPMFNPKLLPKSALHKNNNQWCLPFMGADNSIVYRTQRYFYETEQKRPVQFRAYMKLGSIISALMLMLFGAIVYFMTRISFTRNLLLKYPRLFSFGFVSHEGPTDDVMNNTSFKVTLVGEGWARGSDENGPPNKTVVAKVSGMNPGYGATVVALLYSAITILNEKDKIPAGGVVTTGAAFHKTNYIKTLNENNFKFEILGEK